MEKPLEKWQKALKHWAEWNQSISEIRAHIRNEYGDLDDLLANAKFSVEVGGEDSKPTFNINMNEAEEALWKVIHSLWDASHKFIVENIGICADSFQFHVFRTWWLKSAFPSLESWFELEPNIEEELPLPWYSPQVKIVDGKKIIIDRICWYRKKVEPIDIIRLIPRIWRENDSAIIRRSSGGPIRKNKELIEYPEGIVCHILKYKQEIPEVDIAKMFDWSIYEDDSNHLKPKCSTFRNRMRQARKLIDMTVMKSK